MAPFISSVLLLSKQKCSPKFAWHKTYCYLCIDNSGIFIPHVRELHIFIYITYNIDKKCLITETSSQDSSSS